MPPRQPNSQPRTTVAGRVLGEITNVQSSSSGNPRQPGGQSKVSSAIQHFSRITAAATSSSGRAVISRPIEIEEDREQAWSGYDNTGAPSQRHSLEYNRGPEMPASPDYIRAGFVSSSPPVKSDDDFDDERTTDKRVSQASTGTNSSSTSSGGYRRKTHVGPWRLGRTLGRGSSGRVRLAKHAQTGRLAAVKIVPKSANLDEPDDKSGKKGKDAAGLPYGIEREVIIMKLIEHPNVMGLYDVWENRGELYLILEYVEGGELFEYLIKRGRLEEKEAVHYFRQIILGMDYCHQFNICHRDLKPENLLLDKYHNIKIADFGMAALETSGKMLETSCGSPHYASPEIVAGKTYHGAPSDVWSCGVILFALLTGHLPFDDDNIRNLLMKVQAGRFQMPSDLSIQAKDLIWRILKTDPDERITAAEILDHPLLKKYPSEKTPAQVSGHTLKVDRPVRSIEEIDMEIVKNLQTLWHGEDKKVIIQRLLSIEPNSEKTFYCLLMKYRHDHLENYSAESTPRSSPRHLAKVTNSSTSKLSSRAKAAKSSHPTTPSRSSRHRSSPSKGSVISVSSAHKRGVDFSQVKKKSVHSSTSNPSIKSQNSIARARLDPEPEPPLPQSSSLLIAAIDQLALSLSSGPATNTYQASASAQIQTPLRLSSSPTSPPPALSSSLSSSPAASEDSSPHAPLQVVEYAVRSAKERPAKSSPAKKLVSIGLLDDHENDRVRKVSAEFAASICERAFNTTRYVSDSSRDTGSRTTSASSASTAPTSVGAPSPTEDDRKFSPPLQLYFEPIVSTVGMVDSGTKDEWVREFEQYLQDTGRAAQSTKSRPSAGLQAISEESPAAAVVDEGRFIDAEEDDVDFATEIENLLNTPPVLKRRTTVNTTRTTSSTTSKPPTYSSRAGSSTVSLEYSRLQISSIVHTENFYEFNDDEGERGTRRVSAASTATTGTTIRHASLTSALPTSTEPSMNEPADSSQSKSGPLPVTAAFERQKSFKGNSSKPRIRLLQDKISPANEYSSHARQQEIHTPVSRQQSSIRPVSETVPSEATGASYGKYTPLILDFEEDIDNEKPTKSKSTPPQPRINHPSPQKHASPPEKLLDNSLVTPARVPVKGDEATRWVKFHRSLMPKRAAPPPPTTGPSVNTKKPKPKKKKKAQESNMFNGVIPKPYTSTRAKQNWFSKVLSGIL